MSLADWSEGWYERGGRIARPARIWTPDDAWPVAMMVIGGVVAFFCAVAFAFSSAATSTAVCLVGAVWLARAHAVRRHRRRVANDT